MSTKAAATVNWLILEPYTILLANKNRVKKLEGRTKISDTFLKLIKNKLNILWQCSLRQ